MWLKETRAEIRWSGGGDRAERVVARRTAIWMAEVVWLVIENFALMILALSLKSECICLSLFDRPIELNQTRIIFASLYIDENFDKFNT